MCPRSRMSGDAWTGESSGVSRDRRVARTGRGADVSPAPGGREAGVSCLPPGWMVRIRGVETLGGFRVRLADRRVYPRGRPRAAPEWPHLRARRNDPVFFRSSRGRRAGHHRLAQRGGHRPRCPDPGANAASSRQRARRLRAGWGSAVASRDPAPRASTRKRMRVGGGTGRADCARRSPRPTAATSSPRPDSWASFSSGRDEQNCGSLRRSRLHRGTRIPWVLEGFRRLGWTEEKILAGYPNLRPEDLVHAWACVDAHRQEIDEAIRQNEAA